MKQYYEDVERVHENYILSLNSTSAEQEIDWKRKLQEVYRNCCRRYSSITSTHTVKVLPAKESTFK